MRLECKRGLFFRKFNWYRVCDWHANAACYLGNSIGAAYDIGMQTRPEMKRLNGCRVCYWYANAVIDYRVDVPLRATSNLID
jgi:hypothetical protein